MTNNMPLPPAGFSVLVNGNPIAYCLTEQEAIFISGIAFRVSSICMTNVAIGIEALPKQNIIMPNGVIPNVEN